MLHAQSMQQRDQAGSGLVINAEFQRDPRTDLPCCAWQGLVDPYFQLALLLHRQPADAPFVAEIHQTFDPVLLIQLVPGPDRVIVEKQHLGDGRPHSSFHRQAVPGHWRAGPADARRTHHAPVRSGRVAIPGPGSEGKSWTKQNRLRAEWLAIFRVSKESGYSPDPHRRRPLGYPAAACYAS
jgi:hypothetical protein